MKLLLLFLLLSASCGGRIDVLDEPSDRGDPRAGIEPDIYNWATPTNEYLHSIAISLKRQADAAEKGCSP